MKMFSGFALWKNVGLTSILALLFPLLGQGQGDGIYGNSFTFSTLTANVPACSYVGVDQFGNIYVENYTAVYKISTQGMVTNLTASMTGLRLGQLAVDPAGDVYVTNGGYMATLLEIAVNGSISTVATGLSYPTGITVNHNGTVFVAVSTAIDKIDSQGNADFFATVSNGEQLVLACDTSNNIYALNPYGQIAEISPGGSVTILDSFSFGYGDGPARGAEFSSPSGIAVDGSGNIYVADANNNAIREITSAGMVITLGGVGGVGGNANGTGFAALFNDPIGIAIDGSGNLYVGDTGNGTIRKGVPAVATPGIGSTPQSITFQAIQPGLEADDYQATLSATSTSSLPVAVSVLSGPAVISGNTVSFTGAGLVALGAAQSGTSSYAAAPELTQIFGVRGPPAANPLTSYTSSSYTFTTWAGNPGYTGTSNGPGMAARFWNTTGVAVDSNGYAYVADQFNHTIRKISPSGYVTTLAGLAGTPGYVDATGSAARFGNPTGIAVDAQFNVYVTDNGAVRMITPGGVVTTLASGFYSPTGVAVDKSGNVYVTDNGNGNVDMISPGGSVSILAGGFDLPVQSSDTSVANIVEGLAVDGQGNVYLADYGDGWVSKIASNGDCSVFYQGSSPPQGVAVDANNNVYVSYPDATVVELNPTGTVATLLAGTSGSYGSQDGPGTSALFWNPTALAVDAAGDVYVADSTNSNIRKIAALNRVTTVAGSAGNIGSNDGPVISLAQFNAPSAVATDTSGNSYVADAANGLIRKITSSGLVTTFASGLDDPLGVAVDATGNVFVSEYTRDVIDKITPAGVVSILAGTPKSSGSTNNTVGTSARFNGPRGLAVDKNGDVYVADTLNHVIREITSAGAVSTLAGTAGTFGSSNNPPLFQLPHGVAVDTSGNVFVADTGNQLIREISNGVVSTLAGSAGNIGVSDGSGTSAQFDEPFGIAVDTNANVFIADTGNNTIREITTGTVTTIAGQAGKTGFADNEGTSASFDSPQGIAVEANGYLDVADTANDTIRRGFADSPVENTFFAITVTSSMVGQFQALDFENYLQSGGYEFPYCSIYSGPATLSDNVLTFTGTGTVNIEFNDNGGSPPSVPVEPLQPPQPNPAATQQTLSSFLPTIGTAFVGQSIPLSCTSNSTLPINYSASGPAQISGSQYDIATFTSPGSVTLTANQQGDDMHIAAAPLQQTVTVGVAQAPAITSAAHAIFTIGSANSFMVTTTGFPPATVTEAQTLPLNVSFTNNGNGTATLSGDPAAWTSGPYGLVLTASNGVGTAAQQDFNLTVQTAFDAWAASHGATGGPNGTPENDGVTNLLKYFYGINPARPMNAVDSAAFPTVGMTTIAGAKYLTLTYRQNPSETGLSVAVQTCPDLQSWAPAANATISATGASDPTTGYPIMQALVPVTTSPQFVRLNVTGS